MKTHLITKDQLDQDNNYIGEVDLHNFDGYLESEENLGTVRFKSLDVKGSIYFRKGSGIWADRDIKSHWDIKAGRDIDAGGRIRAGKEITAGGDIEAGEDIEASGNITIGYCIKAGGDIEVGGTITAGRDIEAGYITAGWWIKASGDITAKKIEGVVISGVVKIIKK